MNVSLRKAYTEVNVILNLLGNEYKSRIPKQLLKLFEENQNDKYYPNINKSQKIDDMEISRDALVIISILNLKYWETDEKEIKRLKEIYIQNQIDYQKKMGLYNIKKLF